MTDLDALLPFSAHNVELSDGTQTIPGSELLRDKPWLQGVLRTLDVVLDPGQTARIADIGCLEGGYSLELGRRGHEVLGIEARRSNVARAEVARKDLGLANVRFVQDDARHIDRHGLFDVVFCSGLLYHLDDPVSYLAKLGTVTRRALLLNTHYARAIDPLYDEPGVTDPTRIDFRLGPLTEHEGLPGRWYPEYDEDASLEEVEGRTWASYGNYRSFWPTKPALLEACRSAGFDVIYEQHDAVEDLLGDTQVAAYDRAAFVCVKSSYSRGRTGRVAVRLAGAAHSSGAALRNARRRLSNS